MLSTLVQGHAILGSTTSAVAACHRQLIVAACMAVHRDLVTWSTTSSAAAFVISGAEEYYSERKHQVGPCKMKSKFNNEAGIPCFMHVVHQCWLGFANTLSFLNK